MPPKGSAGQYQRAFKPPRRVATDSDDQDSASARPVDKGKGRVVSSSFDDIEDAEMIATFPAGNDTAKKPVEHPISPKLILCIMHEHFKHDDTKVTPEAMAVMVKYVEIFVKEAIARANFEKDDAAASGAKPASNFLEVCAFTKREMTANLFRLKIWRNWHHSSYWISEDDLTFGCYTLSNGA